jgi:hypothetical protein
MNCDEPLETTCKTWAYMDSEDLRRRAAEGIGWIDHDRTTSFDHPLLEILKSDTEPLVREAALSSLAESRERYWANTYLECLLDCGSNNDDILSAFKYGEALSRMGDDGHRKKLQERLSKDDLPPNVRHWYRLIVKEIDDRWKDVTRNWPEPWLSFEGRGEELDGNLTDETGRSYKAHFSLWKPSGDTPMEPEQWHGAFMLINPSEHPSPFHEDFSIVIPGRSVAKAFVERAEFGGVSFFIGTGRYPEPAT